MAFTAAAYADADYPELDEFPFGELMWTPLSGREDRWAGGALYARDRAWSPSERTLAERLAGTYAHALDALEPARRPLAKTRLTPRGRRILIASLIGTALFPVRLSVVAPVEVVPARAFVMAAPIDGVVDRILVAPNARVEKDQPLFVMDDTTLRNEAALALERRRVAEARYRRAASAAFRDPEEAREIAIAEAEFDLARAEADYASDQLALTEVRAPRAGIAVYSDRRDLEGKGVGVGERVMTIADPMAVEYSVELPPGDLIDLDTGVAVNIYLDSAPLSTINAGLDRVAYQTTKTSDGRDVFRLFAEPDADEAPQRIGARGSARIFGDWVPLIYRVLRRPLAAARQAIGL
ncbi:MAG: HlyD family efflux transporter periplasmic adaptor subunit [Pseudomonadota bacterium]